MDEMTENCIRCLKPARYYGGHVIDPVTGAKILVGWCDSDASTVHHIINLMNSSGCFGYWGPAYGRIPDTRP